MNVFVSYDIIFFVLCASEAVISARLFLLMKFTLELNNPSQNLYCTF